ncbi:hypothetical protein Aduo_000213 [Ancylostoma duodenale]
MFSPLLGEIALFFIVAVSEATKSFGCKNTLITDEWRETVLNYHNRIRRKVAKGFQLTGGGPGKFMRQAGDMHELKWDCNIENNAFLSTCGNTPIPQDFAANSATLSMSGKKCDITENTMTILKKWDSQATAADLSQAPNYDEQKQKEFGIMITGETTGFACSYSDCGSGGKLLCLYNKAPANGQPLYDSAHPTCQACPQPPDTNCVNWLCQTITYIPDVDANPRPECTNLQPGLLGDDEMTYDMQVTAKDMVNYYRNLVATGWAKSKSGYTPTAKAMNALVYDCDTLGAEAKYLATDCTSNSYTSKIGMAVNYHKVKDLTLSEEQVLEKALSTWYSQLENVDLDEKANYDNNVQTRAPSFANLVVGDATKLGCSVHTCEPQGFSVAVCEFDGTPTDGFPLYTVDKACSGCAAGKSCHKGLPGLCA